MGVVLGKLKGISDDVETQLRARGIKRGDHLVNACRTPAQRNELASSLGLAPQAVLELAQRANMTSIRGVGEVYASMLEEAGIHNVHELAAMQPDDLRTRLIQLNLDRRLTARVPAPQMVQGWVTRAKKLSRVLE